MSIPCAHIADFYQHKWEAHHCIAFNMLRHGYRQCAEGRQDSHNNLYEA